MSAHATVVGCGSPARADSELRLRVLFSWPRSRESARCRGYPYGADKAPVGDAHGAWLRVITPVAGAAEVGI